MNTDNKIKIDTCLEYLIKSDAPPEFVVEMIKKFMTMIRLTIPMKMSLRASIRPLNYTKRERMMVA